MNTKVYVVLFVMVVSSFVSLGLHSQSVPASMREIKELFTSGKYSLVLENSLDILNTEESRLTPGEAAFLHYYIGMAYKKHYNYDMAVDYLKKIELKYPASDYLKLAYLELADIFKNDYFQKEAYLEKVFEKFPKTPEAIDAGIELSSNYLRLKNYQKALHVLETIVNLWKKGETKPELYMLLAVAYSGINDYIEAVDYLRQVEKLIPDTIDSNPFYLLEAGKICYNSLNFKKAIAYLEQLFNVFSDYKGIPEAAVLLAQAYEREEKPFLGAIFLVKAIQKKPGKRHLYTLYLHLGRILNGLEERELNKIKQYYPLFSNAERLLTSVKENSMDFQERKTAAILLSDEYKKANKMVKSLDNFYKFLGTHRDPLVEKLFRESLDAYVVGLDKKKNHEELIKAWVKLKERKSFLSPENLLRFGEILYRLKMITNAEEIYRHLVKYRMYAKHWPAAYKQLIRIDFQLGRYEECSKFLKRLDIKKDPELSEFNYYNVLSLQKLKKENELKELLKTNTADVDTINNLYQFRILLVKVGQLEKEKKYDKALNLCLKMNDFQEAPEEDKVHLTIATADLQYKKKEFTEALDNYKWALKSKAVSNTNKEWILFRITIIYRQMGNASEAYGSLKHLKELNPNSFWVRQLEKNAT
ncbi:MAG: tetratricopeptide repeat protein [Candidatus Aminicenantes bacterium]|nr:tetratricopeptide repeat protein [Candidatus Aminicenantes bacterium]NIM81372.1 tetratricopeptide repeat protein [Candidatus Aminicenantes bacterium]NIN20783.1 tetratricopeptide repeat protein [Candidatus Aminicenantes bacterium]NIN44561.1 tetratricopeptide repeat protein [Candidatus Aminicenantes bacterium]NIN87381.1 tetratricopeptide repeat protein [Candidatus Aminicenantes bacterium]